ncbi:MAG: phospholipase D family protein [Bacillaceae bacterium]|nr:phospholipase D family protein [Bacillaceae bacterium]
MIAIKRRGSKNAIIVAVLLIVIYGLYAFISGVLAFRFHQPHESNYMDNLNVDRFYGDEHSQDRVALVEDPFDAGLARVHLIESANHSLDISYHVLHEGKASEVFFSSIISAADRGVQVRVLLDGMFHNLRGSMKDILYVFTDHPNIQLKFYEPIDLSRPWTWNNRLHDKLIIIDKKYAMIGGRNIGDKYFAPEGYEGASNDRDVVIINTNEDLFNESVISQMKDYFDDVWVHEFSKVPLNKLSKRQEVAAKEKLNLLRQFPKTFYSTYPEFIQKDMNWLEQSFPTKQITFIHNPISRMNKEPWVWYELTSLMEHAEKSILIQSPYIIPNHDMMNHLNKDNVTADEILILTNSLTATSNMIAYSGYMKSREDIAAHSTVDLYEFQSSTRQLHMKSFLFDSRISVVGSFNFDPRSTFLSTESMVVIDSVEFATALQNEVETVLTKQSLLVDANGSYVLNSQIEAEDVPFFKAAITKMLSIPMRFFQYML